jgi:catechol 2,3-dioxygenase-like lactoylglutathione lyase family enzyme
MPGINRILETCLYVADLDASQRFYEALFGFQPMLRDDRICALSVPGRGALLLFRTAGSLNPSRTPFGTIPPHGGQGNQHLCFAIDRADLDAWQKRLQEENIPIESRVEWSKNVTSLYFRDPDNHSIELGTAGLWPNDPQEDC